jgi:hypothetical protein
MDEGILRRIRKQAGDVDLVDILARQLSATDLQSLMLEVYRRRAEGLSAGEVLRRYGEDRFVRPSSTSGRALLELDRLALSLLPEEFELLELSPVTPLGSCSTVAPIDPNWAVPTARNTEVTSDSTNVLALECALRRRELLRADPRSAERVRLAASHRLVRPKPVDGPGFFAHFRLFGLCTAGRDEGDRRFETEAIEEQLHFWIRFVRGARDLGHEVRRIDVSLTEWAPPSGATGVMEAVSAGLRARHTDVDIRLDPERTQAKGYYDNLCFQIHAENGKGAHLLLVDGGRTRWTQALLSNRKERLIVSGNGTERLCSVY